MWSPGFPNYDQDPKIKELAYALEETENYSKDKKVDLILGTAWYNSKGNWANTQRYIFNGKFVNEYSKNLLVDAEFIYSRERILPPIIDYNGIRISGLICNDFWSNPVLYPGGSSQLLAYLMQHKVQVVFVSAFVPKEAGPEDSFYYWHLGQIANMGLYCQFITVVSDSTTNIDGSSYNGRPACPVGIWDLQGISNTGEKYFKRTFS
jgi:predicted amidohydrolase